MQLLLDRGSIWTSRIYTPVDPTLKYMIWLARKTVIFHSWYDRFEYYYARIWFGRNYFRVKLIPPIENPNWKDPNPKKIEGFYRGARFRRGQMRHRRGIKEHDSRPANECTRPGIHIAVAVHAHTVKFIICMLSAYITNGYKNYTIAHESNMRNFPLTMIKWLSIFDFVQLLDTLLLS